MQRLFGLIFILWMSFFPSYTLAGSSEAGKAILPAAQTASFANRVQRDLASRGAHVAIVARTGRDPALLPKGITYTHVSFWVFSKITQANGRTDQGYRVYNLYQEHGNASRSILLQDSPADFFAPVHSLDAGIIIPDVRLQQKLLNAIASPTYAALHNPKYSVLANPNNRQFQNCTEHTLDVIMASLYNTRNAAQIKANITEHFDPQPIRIGGVKRLLAPVTSKALSTQDHGANVATATFGSIARFMEANALASEIYRITPGKVQRL